MKHALITASIILLVTVLSFAQPPEIQWTTIFGGTLNDYFKSIDLTSDGGYIMTGYTESYGSGFYDVYLVKADQNGISQWETTYGYPTEDMGSCVVSTTDGGYALTGHMIGLMNYYQMCLVKTDANGNLQIQETYGGEGDDRGYCLKQTYDGGYILAGVFESNTPSNNYNGYLVKANPDGHPVWETNFGGTSHDEARGVAICEDGGYIVTGYTESSGAGGKDVYLVKVNSNGIVVWEQTFGGSGNDEGNSVLQTSDGGYLVGGYTESFGSGSWDCYVIKTNANGISEWEQYIGGPEMDACEQIEMTSDNCYVLAGRTANFGAENLDVLAVKIDASGNTLWTATVGTGYNDIGYGIKQTEDGGFTIAGKSGIYFADDAYLVRFGPEGAMHDVTVTLTPYGAPIQIPANGGSFDFNIAVENAGEIQETFDIWTMATLPNGSEYGPIINVQDFTAPAGFSGNRDRIQAVPASAPSGGYTYDAYVGIYPNTIWDEDHFEFSKASDSDGSEFYSGWNNWGESFDDFGAVSSSAVPDEYTMFAAYPNPFNPTTTISYKLQSAGNVSLSAYDVTGCTK